MTKVLRPYLGYVLNFVGAGMVSGGVVHYPLNEAFYGALTIIGSFVFTAGALLNEYLAGNKIKSLWSLFRVVVVSLLLSFGIGMLSGGIQHFTDFPDRATVLVPVGLLLSYLAFCVKHNSIGNGLVKKTLVGGAVIVVLASSSYVGLGYLAKSIETAGHSHGTADGHHDVVEETPAEETPAVVTPEEAPAEKAPSSDGHTDHDH